MLGRVALPKATPRTVAATHPSHPTSPVSPHSPPKPHSPHSPPTARHDRRAGGADQGRDPRGLRNPPDRAWISTAHTHAHEKHARTRTFCVACAHTHVCACKLMCVHVHVRCFLLSWHSCRNSMTTTCHVQMTDVPFAIGEEFSSKWQVAPLPLEQ